VTNRADRRRRERKAPLAIRLYALNYRCPDCINSTSEPYADEHGVWHIDVAHDETCPSYRRLRALGWVT
jgi:hypothetical protein